jgi:hypothetical protein
VLYKNNMISYDGVRTFETKSFTFSFTAMKHLFTAACLLAGGAAHAQITITAAQFPATAASVDRYQAATLTGAAVPTPGANQTWDYRSLTPLSGSSVATSTYSSAGATPPFTNSVRSYPLSIPLGAFNVNATAYEGFDAQGFSQLGSAIPAQSFPLVTVTGGATDVLSIPAQTATTNVLRVPLPLTTTTKVQRTSRVVNNSTLTIQALLINQASFQYVQRFTTVDSVAGWGTVRIPVAGSAAGSAPIQTLLVQRRVIEQDSFYLNGQPAQGLLLLGLGQTQGSITRTYGRYFYRQNSAQYLLGFSFATSAYTAPTAIAYSAETAIPLNATAAREVTTGGLTAWPNPAARGQALSFALATVAPAQPLRLTLRDALGRVVAATVAPNGRPASLPALPAGLYLAEAEAADGTRFSRRVVVE